MEESWGGLLVSIENHALKGEIKKAVECDLHLLAFVGIMSAIDMLVGPTKLANGGPKNRFSFFCKNFLKSKNLKYEESVMINHLWAVRVGLTHNWATSKIYVLHKEDDKHLKFINGHLNISTNQFLNDVLNTVIEEFSEYIELTPGLQEKTDANIKKLFI